MGRDRRRCWGRRRKEEKRWKRKEEKEDTENPITQGKNQSKPKCEKASEDRKKEKEKTHYRTTILN